MSTNGGNGLIVAVALYLLAGAAHYGAGLVASPCRNDNVSISRSLFWPAALNNDVITGTSSLKDFALSHDCRDQEFINPKKWNELMRQARGQR